MGLYNPGIVERLTFFQLKYSAPMFVGISSVVDDPKSLQDDKAALSALASMPLSISRIL